MSDTPLYAREPGIRVTVEDLATGDVETQEIFDDYLILVVGNRYVAGIQTYPKSGTHVITVKVEGASTDV